VTVGGRINAYGVLGLHPSADQAAIKRAYRRLIRDCHPDVTVDQEAAARASEINAAYELLETPERRAAYDRDFTNIVLGWTERRRSFSWAPLARWCQQCGHQLHGYSEGGLSPSGRWRRHDALYCSNACRQRAYRARKAAVGKLDRGTS
jgi:curved DNA-binding protein CbpA